MDYQTISDFTDLKLDPSIKAVVLDFDDTCYIYEPCQAFALATVQNVLEKQYGTDINFLERYKQAKKEVKRNVRTHAASHVRLLYFQTLLHKLPCTAVIKESLDLETLYWKQFISKMEPTAGLFDFLAQCNKNDTTVVVITDLTTRIQFQKMTALGISDFVDYVVTSEEAGAEKPDPVPFMLALEKCGQNASSVVMIGDDKDKDILGAQRMGMSAIHIIHEKITPKIPLR